MAEETADGNRIPFLPPPDRHTTQKKTKGGIPYQQQEITRHPAHDLNVGGIVQRYDDFVRTWKQAPAHVVMGWDLYESLVVVYLGRGSGVSWPSEFMGVPVVVVSQEGFCEFVHDPQRMFRLRGVRGGAKG